MSTEDRRRAAKAALDHGNELFHSPSWRSSVQEYETALRRYTDLDDVGGGQADVLCNLASVVLPSLPITRSPSQCPGPGGR